MLRREDGDGSGREPFAPPAPRKLVPSSQLQDFFHTAPDNNVPLMLRAPTSQPQQQAAPAALKPFDFSSWSTKTDLFQPKPLSVQVVPEQKPVVLQAQQQPVVIGPDPGYMDGTFPVSPWIVDEQFAAQKVVDEAAGKVKHDQRILDLKAYEAADQTETAKEMSPKEWASLTPLQQASVQSNYDLAAAVKKDFDSQGKHDSDQFEKDDYNNRVKELFGEEESLGYKGMNFAPNTIAFLDERGYKAADIAGRTLDDFLSGSALVSAETFKGLEEVVLSPDVFHTPDARGKNIQFAQTLAKGQLAYQEDLAIKLKQGAGLLADITSASTSAAAGKSYGALQTPTQQLKFPAIQPATFAQLDKYMEALARTDFGVNEALATITADLQERGVSPEESAQVWQGLSERSHQAATGEGKWFEGVDFPMRAPAEVAQALGATTLKRQATTGLK